MPAMNRVFISYSQESDEHSASVVALADQLREQGVEAMVDRYAQAPPEGWPRWIERQISESEFVVCVCSPLYRKGFEGENDGHGLGVNYEGFLILQDLYDKGNRTNKYVAVVLAPSVPKGFREVDLIPSALRAFSRYTLPRGYENFYRQLTHQPETEAPSLGRVRELQGPTIGASLPQLPQQSTGFEQQAELSRHVSPSQYPLERLAPSDGLFLSRIINPQHGSVAPELDGAPQTTVWIAARGPLDYVADSIRIRHRVRGLLGTSGARVAIVPDANYRFAYPVDSDRMNALNPALLVGPSARDWAWFTLITTMEGGSPGINVLSVWLQYHGTNGRQGTLLLADVPPAGARLAKLVASDVVYSSAISDGGKPPELEFESMVITPNGLQRGLEPEDLPSYQFSAIPMGPVWRSERLGEKRGIAVARKKIADVLRKRAALNEALRQPSIRVQLSDWFSVEPGFTAADLIGGLADEEGTQQLLQSYRRGLKSAEIDERGRKRHPSVADASLFGLQIRHLVCGDDVLGKLILERDDLYDWNYEKELSSLILRPTPALVDALARITGGETWEVISAIADNLDASQCERILAWPEGPLGSGLFVRGSMNEWMAKPEGKLVYDLQGTYHVRLALQTGRHELKIGGSEWYRWNFGGTEPGKRLTLGEPLELWGSDLSSNIVLDIEVSGQYRFDVDVRSLSRLLLSCHSV